MRFLSLPAPIHLAVAATMTMLSGTAFAQGLPTSAVQATGNNASQPLAAIVAEAAHRFGIPEGWIWAVMRVESAGRTRAVSSAGAQGLMQIMPATWTRLRARHGLGENPFDARDNVLAGASYLREMYDRYGSVTAMLAAYNAGPGRYEAYAAGARGLPLETTRYVARIAPAIGTPIGNAGAQTPSPTLLPDRRAWMQAALFVRNMVSSNVAIDQSDRDDQTGRNVVSNASARRSPGGVSADAESAPPRPDRRQGNGLFVPRSVAGQVP